MNKIKNTFEEENNKILEMQSDEIVEIFKSIKRSLNIKFEKTAKKYGFTAPQLGVIFILSKDSNLTLNEVSEKMMLSKSTVSGIIERLSQQGVVLRKTPESNRRIVRLSLSEDFLNNTELEDMRKDFIFDMITNPMRKIEPSELKEIIKRLRQFSEMLVEEI